MNFVEDDTSQANGSGFSGSRLRSVGLIGLAGIGIYLCFRLAQPCIPALVWAGALALIFAPLHRRIEKKVHRPTLAAVLTVLVVGLLVVVPAMWFAQSLAEQATTVPQSIQKQIDAGKWHMSGADHPQAARILDLFEREITAPENTSAAASWLKGFVSNLIRNSALAVVQVCLTLYFLFYLLRDRTRVVKDIRFFLPLTDKEANALFSRVNTTIHAIVYSMLGLSVVQGVLGGLLYWALGVPSPCFWALVMALFAFVPVLDTIVIWVPAGVYLGLEGRWAEATVVAGLASLIIRAIENVLYPVLVKKRLRVPSVTIFIALLGGMVLFGWTGLVLGPLILTITNTLLKMCANRLQRPDNENIIRH